MKTKKYISYVAQYTFILLWGGTIALKLRSWQETTSEIQMQGFSLWLTETVLWGLPLVFVLLIGLLIYRPNVNLGIRLSTALITVFTLYLVAGITKVFGYTPCACAGLWPTNNHWLHIALNSIFIIIGIIYLILAHKSHPGGDVDLDHGRKEGIVSS